MIDWPGRFARYVERKTTAALAAPLSPFTTGFDRAGRALTPIGNAWTRSLFDGAFYVSEPSADLPATSLVFVQSKDGNTVAPNPSMLGGGHADAHLIYEGLSRVAADAVLSGAATIRGGEIVLSVWHPELVALRETCGLPRHPVQIVASLRGLNLDEGLLFNVPAIRVVILTVPGCEPAMRDGVRARPWVGTVVMRTPGDLESACRTLRETGIRRISAIGGRTVARALLDAGLVQDLYLTTSPRTGGEPHTGLAARPPAAEVIVRKDGSGADVGVVFEHIRLNPSRRS